MEWGTAILPLSCSLWTVGRSELTRLASLLTTDPEDTGVALLEAGASSVGDEAGAEGSPEVSAALAAGGGMAAGVGTL